MAMLMLLHGFHNNQKIWPNMSGVLRTHLDDSLADLDEDGMLVETNNPEIPICTTNEIILFEHLYLNKAALKSQKPFINIRLPISSERITRHLALAGGIDFYKLRKVTRAHVVFLSNLKVRVIDENGKV